MNCLVDCRRVRHRVAVDANVQCQFVFVAFQQRNQDQRRGFVHQPPVLCVGCHTHHRVFEVVVANVFSKSTLARPVAVHQRLVHNRHTLLGIVVRARKVAAREQGRAQRLQVIRPHDSPIHFHRLVRLWNVSLRHNAFGVNAETQWREICESCGLHARQRLHALQQLTVEHCSAAVGIAHRIKIEGRQQNMIGIKTRIHRLRLCKAADEKSRAGQQRERQGHLRHHQPRSQARLVQSAARIQRFVLQDRLR